MNGQAPLSRAKWKMLGLWFILSYVWISAEGIPVDERRCVLCNQPASEADLAFSLTPEARAFLDRQFPGTDPTRFLTENVLCARCAALPANARSARDAIARELESYAMDLRRERLSMRIDIGRTIDSVHLTDETWEWLNVIGSAITLTQAQAGVHDANTEWFKSYDDYKWMLVSVIAKDINTLGAIFLTLRCEWAHQAAALLRTLYESLITLRYVAQDKSARSKQFLGYAVIEEYKMAESFLRWDAAHSKREHLAKMKALKEAKAAKYGAARATYTFKNRKGQERPFSNWCNRKISDMAKDTGSERLYGLVYSQTSAYVHASAWSLRAVGAFSRKGYDARRALVDTSTLVRTTMAVWFEWATFCNQQLGWTLHTEFVELRERLDVLQAALDATISG